MPDGLDDRLRTLLTLGVLTVLLVVGAAWGWSAATQPFPGRVETPTCVDTPVAEGSKVFADQVTVSVLNAGNREGLAGRTMRLLTDDGFGEGDLANAPAGTKVGNAEIWAEAPDDPAVRLVRSRLGKGVKVVRRDTDTVGVTVVVGDGFEELVEGRESVTAKRDATICSPPDS